MKKYLYIIFSLLLFQQGALAQLSDEKANVINKYILYSNENTHGMLIVHRLLEIYNQELNKYVDLEGYPLNFISNEDFEENIFEDKERMYYRISPYQLLRQARSGANTLPAVERDRLDAPAVRMKSIADSLNNIRFRVEQKLANTDLEIMDNIKEIYVLLEKGVELYDNYELERKKLSTAVQSIAARPSGSQGLKENLHGLFYEWEEKLHPIFDQLRKEADVPTQEFQQFQIKGRKFTTAAKDYLKSEGLSEDNVKRMEDVIAKVDLTIAQVDEYRSKPSTPESYGQYGNAYYYYNVKVASSVNKYGTGAVAEFNLWLKDNAPNLQYLFERPHFYKVIYPQQREKLDVSALNVPSNAPRSIENRTVVMSKSKVINASGDKIRIELYDHQEIDGDIVSINYNNRWIVKEYTLQRKPRILVLPVEKGENFLVLFAENLGAKPPNTMAIKYLENGDRKTMILNSDLKQSEMIIIRSAD